MRTSEKGIWRGLKDFWNETNPYMIIRPHELRGIGSVYKRDPVSSNAVYIDDLKNLGV